MDPLEQSIRNFLADEKYRLATLEVLLTGVRDRDDAAMRELLRREGDKVLQHCRAILRGDDRADDAFQETFVALLKNLMKEREINRLSNPDRLIAWLYKTARNKAISILRKVGSDHHKEMETGAASVNPCIDPADAAMASEEASVNANLITLIRQAILTLPTREREVLELVFLEGMTHTRAAAALKMSRGSVGTYALRGLHRLRQKLPVSNLNLPVGAIAGVSTALSTAQVAKAAEQILRRAATIAAKWSVVKPLVILAVICLSGGLAVGSLSVFDHPVADQAVQHGREQSRTQVDVPAMPESLEVSNQRAFDELVRPKFTAALAKLALGEGGRVEIPRVETYGTRLFVEAHLIHGKPLAFISKLRITYDTERRDWRYMMDRLGNGRFHPVDPGRPITIFRDPFGVLKDWEIKVEAYTDAANALHLMPHDPRGASELARIEVELDAAVAKYAGVWLRRGNPVEQIVVSYRPNNLERIEIRGPGVYSCFRLHHLWLDKSKHLHGMFASEHTISPDGMRIDLIGQNEWWVRE
jgi:RNA polymerase sigma factor (sigma-70 family)